MLRESKGKIKLDPRTSDYVTDAKELQQLIYCLEVFVYDVYDWQFDVNSFSYKFQCALILNEPYTPIKCIKNQTEEQHILSVSQAPVMFFFIRNYSEKVVDLFLEKYKYLRKDYSHHHASSFFEKSPSGHERFIELKIRKMRRQIPKLPLNDLSSPVFGYENIFGYDLGYREIQHFFPDKFQIEYDQLFFDRIAELFPRIKDHTIAAPYAEGELRVLKHLSRIYSNIKNPAISSHVQAILVYEKMNGTL